jgi:hypothetical protein
MLGEPSAGLDAMVKRNILALTENRAAIAQPDT